MLKENILISVFIYFSQLKLFTKLWPNVQIALTLELYFLKVNETW